ncbi:uncharacterized protein LOC134440736 [Engraulis encrasicolus]|uniref:uncharacterized protein LOC134440736 n=1 Tax=Engraulis encrasicolus TaxID=184585 RepID=UPI002FD1ED63
MAQLNTDRRELLYRPNTLGWKEQYVSAVHMKLADLRGICRNQYLNKEISEPGEWTRYEVPHYPHPVEFHASTIAHETNEVGARGILQSGGFKGLDRELLWWHPQFSTEEVAAAEQRYLDKVFPERTEGQRRRHEERPFLHHFTTSHAFTDESRFGNFHFSFQLEEILQAYSTQFCAGQRPVFRKYETVIYRQNITYKVLVHSPSVDHYDCFPILGDNEDVCAYSNGEIIWHAQAICGTHTLELNIARNRQHLVAMGTRNEEFYAWDVVSLALHVPKRRIFQVSEEALKAALTACGPDDLHLNDGMMSLDEAEAIVNQMRAT